MRGLVSAMYARTAAPALARVRGCDRAGLPGPLRTRLGLAGRWTLTALTWDETTFRPAWKAGHPTRLHAVVGAALPGSVPGRPDPDPRWFAPPQEIFPVVDVKACGHVKCERLMGVRGSSGLLASNR